MDLRRWETLVDTYELYPTEFPQHSERFNLIHTRIWRESSLNGKLTLRNGESTKVETPTHDSIRELVT